MFISQIWPRCIDLSVLITCFLVNVSSFKEKLYIDNSWELKSRVRLPRQKINAGRWVFSETESLNIKCRQQRSSSLSVLTTAVVVQYSIYTLTTS